MKPALAPTLALAIPLVCAACSGFWSDRTEPTTMRQNPPRAQTLAHHPASAEDPQTPDMMTGTRRFGPGPAGTPCGVTADYPCK